MRTAHGAGAGSRRLVAVGAVLLPALLAVAWIPARASLPNVDVALALVLAVTLAGATGRRACVWLAAAAAAAGFAFFDTEPYEHWVISRQPDLETLLVLAVVSLVTGELAVRFSRLRARSAPHADGMDRVRELAALVASGAELVDVIGAVGAELGGLLGAASWTYEAGAGTSGAVVRSDGSVGPGAGIGPGGEAGPGSRHRRAGVAAPVRIEVPVRGMGRVLGRFVLGGPRADADRDTLLLALTLADQVAAALIAQAPQTAAGPRAPDDPPPPRPALRVVD